MGCKTGTDRTGRDCSGEGKEIVTRLCAVRDAFELCARNCAQKCLRCVREKVQTNPFESAALSAYIH